MFLPQDILPPQSLSFAQNIVDEVGAGDLSLIVQECTPGLDYVRIAVHVKHTPSNRTITLFAITYKTGQPVSIAVNDEPRLLKASSLCELIEKIENIFKLEGIKEKLTFLMSSPWTK